MRPRARARAAFAAGVLVASLVIGVAPVAAAAQSFTVDRTLAAGPIALGGNVYTISGVINGTIEVSATAELSQPIRQTLSYDDANVRQGRSIDVTRSVATNGAGSLTVVWTVGGSLAGSGLTRTKTVPCTVGFTSPVTCNATSSSIRLVGQVPIPGSPILDLELQASVTVTPNSAEVKAATLSGGVVIMKGRTALLPGTQSFDVPCSAAAGDTLAVDETDFANLTHLDATNGPAISIGVWIPIPIPPFVVDGSFATIPVGLPAASSIDQFLLDATSQVTDLGIIKPNNVPPVADASLSPSSGVEGSPIHLDGSASSALCGPPTLRWDFSDGGVAFGATPFHTFADNGTFSGQLTATDTTGLSSTTTFSIDVSNQNPVVSAGPDTTSAWGRLVAFNGSATDPGSADQATLTYSWDFGDGTPPSASGGPSVFHSYSTPADYTATLTVYDKDGGHASDSRIVHVRKRTVSVGYLGDTAGTYDTQGSLSGSLVDEFGSPVNGRKLTFFVSGGTAGSAVTSSSGVASTAYTPLLDAASYGTAASFDGTSDTLYESGSGSGSITIAHKASTVTYSGALTGGPNKTITLSAKLVDATGKALGGRTITFKLGTQSISVATDVITGVASTPLKLTQKNGKYPLTATWTPAGPDAARYSGSAASTTFSLQAK